MKPLECVQRHLIEEVGKPVEEANLLTIFQLRNDYTKSKTFENTELGDANPPECQFVVVRPLESVEAILLHFI
ncbi:hypothetical protein A4G99_07035 [Haladaptatus sp. R4]|nr:hypothetical protein A4G99_07035 [Haladaptatus sp. R4]